MNKNNTKPTENKNYKSDNIASAQSFLQSHENELHNVSKTEERCNRILELSDRLLDKISRAIDEVDICIVKDKKRVKEVEYDDELKKPTKETYTETENVSTERTTVDTGALKQLVSTLKDIRDIQLGIGSSSENDENSERGIIVISDVITTGKETML